MTLSRVTEKGFTLVEIIVVVVILAVIALFAAPEIINFGPNMRVKAASRDLNTNIQKLKLEAIKNNSNVVMLINTVACGGLPSVVPSPGGTYQMFIDNGAGAGGVAGDGIQNGTEKFLPFTDKSGDAIPDTDYDLPKNTALCGATSANLGFTSRGLFLDPTTNIEPLPLSDGSTGFLFTLNNDRNRTYTVSVSIASGIKTEKI